MKRENVKAEKWKQCFTTAISLLIILTVFWTAVLSGHAETVVDKPVNFVLVLDCSGSMWKENDKGGLTEQSAKMFVDKLQHENTNLSIIVLGCDYSEENPFDIGSDDPDSVNRVKVAFPLQDISSEEARNNAKEIIAKEVGRKNEDELTMTPIGYALQAAISVLQEGKADNDHAAIILLSDGRMEGQDDGYNIDSENIAHDYYSVDEATQTAADNNWPIYAMELNYTKGNKEGNGLPGVGYHLMREKIPEVTGTDPLELTSSKQAEELFMKIIKDYYNVGGQGPDPVELNKPYGFHIDELTVESTISITGDINKVESLNLESPSKTKNYELNETTSSSREDVLVVEDGYIVLTLLVPDPGDWTLTIEGEGTYQYSLSVISLQESNLQLHASKEGGEIGRGTTVEFTASYIYNDHQFESEDLYRNHPAKLVIKGIESLEMKANDSNYNTSYTFDKAGSYTVFVRVEDDIFRQGYKDSGQFVFTIENAAPVVAGGIPDQDVDVGKELSIKNVDDLFSDPEGDQITFSFDAPPESGIKETGISGGMMKLKTGKRAGEYEVRILASDGSETAEIPFKITVNNHPLERIGAESIDIGLVVDNPDNNTKEITWDDLFTDPDGYAPDVSIEKVNNKGINVNDIPNGVSFSATEKGNADFIIRASDANDPNVTEIVTIHISANTKLGAFIDRIIPILLKVAGLIIFIVIILLILFYRRYRNYGFWSINNQEVKVYKFDFAKKKSFRLDELLIAVGEPSGFGNNVRISVGTNLNKKVYIENLNQVNLAKINGNPISTKEGKKVELKKENVIFLSNAGVNVTLVRH